MKNAEAYNLNWQDVAFGLAGSTAFILSLQYFIGF